MTLNELKWGRPLECRMSRQSSWDMLSQSSYWSLHCPLFFDEEFLLPRWMRGGTKEVVHDFGVSTGLGSGKYLF